MNNKIFPILIGGLLVLLALACSNLPFIAEPTAIPTSTPDITLTAIFAILQASPTQAPAVTATNTLAPISPPTATATLPATNTLVPTEAPTKTKKPTQTFTSTSLPPTARPGGSVVAYYMEDPPKIDGSLGEWNLDQYAIESVVYGKDLRTDSDDLSGFFMIGWDETYLYLIYRVRDDKYMQKAEGEDLYKGDSVELLVDVNLQGDYYYSELSADDFQLGISPGKTTIGNKEEAYLWFPKSLKGGRSDVKIAAKDRTDGYNVEIAVPWELFDITPKTGMHLGFCASISDNDHATKNVQQSMVSNVAKRSLTNPTTWGNLVLKKP